MENYYLFYSQRCPDSKIFLDKLAGLTSIKVQYFAIEEGKYPQTLQVVPAIMIDNGSQQQLLQGQDAFKWLNDKNISSMNSESTSTTAYSFLDNNERSAMADRTSTPWSNTPQQQGGGPPQGMSLPSPQSMKSNAEQKAQKSMDALLEERNRQIIQPPSRA